MTAQDTLRLTSEQYEAWHSDRSYDYDSQFATSGRSLGSMIGEWLDKMMSSFVGNETYWEYRTWIWCTVAVVLLIVIFVFLWYKHPKLFQRDSKATELEYDVVEDNIYGVDFDSKLQEAVDAGDFSEAVRLRYLQTLRWLSDRKLIDWQPFKTPSQYSAEYREHGFRSLTILFQRIRYGGFVADRQIFEEADRLYSSTVEKGVQHDGDDSNNGISQREGGTE